MGFIIVYLGIIMVESYHKAQIIAEKIITHQMPFDLLLIREQIILVSGVVPESLLSSLTVLLVLAWVTAAINTYYLGKKLDATDNEVSTKAY